MDKNKWKTRRRRRRHRRLRTDLEGTPERPRLCVYRSNTHTYAQVIDDWNEHTLTSACTRSPALREELDKSWNVEAAARVGDLIARRCLEHGIEQVVFDRGGFRYHGRVRALAEAARKRFEEAGAEGF